ncbi:MAG: low molecular weight protein-tyrosine-phosphatase [Alphaproteobacteria bacterium]|nr:low molecular weight protein-tyrosine-phosphatase [Alphaproteobacteria bacterium]MDP7183358.1 low molecular weight protein-tyrosine-phosphatase [Alphaproteobacteria bacterium]MDP7191135.1 low molecular weight protein-tyrosine-phosphatase [Alphaproteobacteria bacterium]MDP7456451.1 low molecular weight protein-tyrosine-phosphatase [Alphaproteobacteria bacterium]HJO88244.1 low molecular weight protein-tyrosine-phosphatase [Alphaproteobacteria bacterium]
MVSILFVCTGNICRSPTAEAVLRKMVRDEKLEKMVLIESAGITDFHEGQAADTRAQETARARGIDMEDIRARRITAEDFQRFDYLLAMDRSHLRELQSRGTRLGADIGAERMRLFMEFAPAPTTLEVPDPYYSGQDGFALVFDMIEAASRGLLEEIYRTHS